jgi:hypothetical protein
MLQEMQMLQVGSDGSDGFTQNKMVFELRDGRNQTPSFIMVIFWFIFSMSNGI